MNIQEAVNKFYMNYPYPLISNPFSRTHKRLMKKLLRTAGLSLEDVKDLKVLDAGCGTGEKSVYLASLGAEVVGVDINPGQLEHAKKLAEKYNLNVEFRKEDLLDLKLNRKFDLIMSTGVLHHTPNAKRGFDNLAPLLSKRGRIIIGLYNWYARMKYRIIRYFLHKRYSSPEEIMDFVLKSPLNTASYPTLYDRYAVPFESYHTLEELASWFKEHKIKPLSVYPEGDLKHTFATQLKWTLKGKTFFVLGGIKE